MSASYCVDILTYGIFYGDFRRRTDLAFIELYAPAQTTKVIAASVLSYCAMVSKYETQTLLIMEAVRMRFVDN